MREAALSPEGRYAAGRAAETYGVEKKAYERHASLWSRVRKQLIDLGGPDVNLLRTRLARGTVDLADVKKMDELVDHFASYEPEHFGSDTQEAERNLTDFLERGPGEAPKYEEHYGRAVQEYRRDQAEREAGRGDEPEGATAGQPSEVEPGVNFMRIGGRGRTPRPGTPPAQTTAQTQPVVIPPEKQGTVGAGILRQHNSEKVERTDRDAKALSAGEKFFQSHVEAAPAEANLPVVDQTRTKRFLEFMDAVEAGQLGNVPADQQEFAQTYRRLHDEYTSGLQARELLDQNVIADHVGHLWADPQNPNATPEEVGRALMARRPLAGREGFRKQRVIPTYRDGIEAGLVPKSWNPATLAKLEFDQYSKSIFGHDAFEEAKAQGLAQFVPLDGRAPSGWKTLPDKLWRVFAPAEVKVKEFVDKQQMEGLENFAKGIGVKLSRVMTGEPGYQVPGPRTAATPGPGGEIVTRFGTPEEVLAHEIGHEIDSQYPQLRRDLKADPAAWAELEKLADLRASGRQSTTFQDYLRSPPERVANLVAAYVHAPELLGNVAPGAKAVLEKLLTSTPRLQDLMSIKPSLELTAREQMMRVAGPMLTGGYYMPEAVARLFENHMSEGLASSRGALGAGYRAFRGFGNQMSQFLLGWSGYHATATVLNAQFSAMAEALGAATRGDFAEMLRKGPEAVVPGLAAVQAVRRGLKVRAEWDLPGSQTPEVQEQVRWLQEMGGRARGGSEYMGSNLESLQGALRQIGAGKYGKVPEALARALPALNQLVSKPTMDYLVPLIKVGVATDAMRYEMRRNPGMDLNARREVGAKIWDAMDDRFGLLTYDNLFLNRQIKDALQTGFLSFGWNAGDVRGLGGGVADVFKPSQWAALSRGEGISRRTGFLLSLMAGTAVYGALYQLLATGKGPEETKDLWFPKTGQKNHDGTDERVSLPGYMKDIASVTNRAGQGPLQVPRNVWGMGKGKISPAIRLAAEILDNEDWRRAAIDDPSESWASQAKDDALHVLEAFEPISVSSYRQQQKLGANPLRQVQGFAGITPAPYRITHTDEQLLEQEKKRRFEPTPLEKRRKKIGAK